ncbi:sulfurtransferase [Dongia sp.]|uniref:sulfurtransferase n=1 Tax=Dongia sp. TaxID=1977262 RepID=UPI0035B21D61
MLQPKSLIIAGFLAITPIAVGAVTTLTGLAGMPAAAIDVIGFERKWLLSVDEARALIASGALVVDARNAELRARSPIRNAAPLQANELAGTDADIAARLQSLGLSNDEPAVILGDPAHGLGEDAALVLALRSLGHGRVAMVDGGLPALLAAGLPTVQAPFGAGTFAVARNDSWSLDAARVKPRDFQLLESDLSADLLTPDGRLKTADQIAAILAGQGIDRDSRIATAGRRSAWLAAILLDQGYDARQIVGGELALTAAN